MGCEAFGRIRPIRWGWVGGKWALGGRIFFFQFLPITSTSLVGFQPILVCRCILRLYRSCEKKIEVEKPVLKKSLKKRFSRAEVGTWRTELSSQVQATAYELSEPNLAVG